MRQTPPIDRQSILSSPVISNDSDLSAALQRSLTIAGTPTVASLRREAALRARDASLCLREAAILQREADQLNGEADALYRRERRFQDAQNAQFELNMYQNDGEDFWNEMSTSTPDEDDDLSSTATSITPAASTSRSHAPSQSTSTVSSIASSTSASRSHARSQSTSTASSSITSSASASTAQRVRPVTPPAINRHAGDTRVYKISSPTAEGVVRSWSVNTLAHLFPH